MDEIELFELLGHNRVEKRLRAIEALQSTVQQQQGDCLPFTDCQELFLLLSTALEDSVRDMKVPCLRLMMALVPCLGTDGPLWISFVLPSVIQCFTDSRSDVHRLIVQVLQSSLKKLPFQNIMHTLVDHGLENDDFCVRKAVISFMPTLFSADLKDRNFLDLVHALIACLSDKSLQPNTLKALQELSRLVGEDKFSGYVDAMPNRLQELYSEVKKDENAHKNTENNADLNFRDGNMRNQKNVKSHNSKDNILGSYSNGGHKSNQEDSLRFGIFPRRVIQDITDDLDSQSHNIAHDELKSTIEKSKNLNLLTPHLPEFIDFLVMLLDDSNSKVNKAALDVFAVVIERFDVDTLKPHIRRLLVGLTKHLGDNIPFFREGIMKLVVQLMHISSPRSCMSVICENLSSRNSSVRHESVNVIIVALLTFPSSDFDLGLLCEKIAFALVDSKKLVRQAALECLAVLNQALGPRQRSVLTDAVQNCEKDTGVVGALVATQARLANLQLPKIGKFGTVEYVTCGGRNNGGGNTADIEWILSGASGYGSSARSCLSDSVVSMDWSEKSSPPPSGRLESATLFTRSRPSMRKSLAKMPWDTVGSNGEFSRRQVMRRNASSGDVTKVSFAPQPGQHVQNDFSPTNGELGGVCPLPTGPRLVRSGSIKRISSCSAVPPIRSRNNRRQGVHSSDVTQSCWFPDQTTADFNFRTESSDSTRSLRNSAGKRKVAKMFGKFERKEESRQHNENSKGQFSTEKYTDVEWRKENGLLESTNFNGLQSISKVSKTAAEGSYSTGYRSSDPSTMQQQYRPSQEVTLHSNPTTDVAICGKSYAEETETQPDALMSKAYDQRRASKAIGKDYGDDRPIKPAKNSFLDGIYGFNVYNLPSDDTNDREHLGERSQLKASTEGHRQPTTKDDFRNGEINFANNRQQNRINALEARRQRLAEEIRKEKQKRLDSANRLDCDDLDDSSQRSVVIAEKPPLKLANREQNRSRPKKSSAVIVAPSASSAPVVDGEEEDPSELKPSSNPTSLLSETMKQLAQEDDWEVKCRGLNNLRRLAIHHAKVFAGQTVSVGVAVVREVKSLRSSVSVLATKCLADMFANLKSDMDIILDQTVGALLVRSGDANNFIREEAEKSLRAMAENIAAQKSLSCLISLGSKHRNASIRALTAQLILSIAESLGPGHVLSGVRDITDKILPAAAAFLLDSSPEARLCGRKIFHMLLAHQDFDKILPKYLSKETLSDIQDKLEQLRTRGLDDIDTNSSRSRRMASVERNPSSRNRSATRPSSDSSLRGKRIDEASKSEVQDVLKNLSTNDYRERCKGLEQLRNMTITNLTLFASSITLIFDRFVPCLRDANSKVTHLALQVLQEIIPLIHGHMGNLVSITVEPLVGNLASNNREIRDISAKILDLFVEFFNPSVLLPSFSNQTQNCVSLCKPVMIQRITHLVSQLQPNRRKCLTLHVLPLLWYLLNMLGGSGSLSSSSRLATSDLVKALHAEMDEGLLHAASSSNMNQRSKALLKEMIERP